MKVGLIATHSFPIGAPGVPHTGDVVILDLAHGLEKLGHDVTVVAPAGTRWHRLLPMACSMGKYPPSSHDCEMEAARDHMAKLATMDVIHDFSVTKRVSEVVGQNCKTGVVQTLMGGPWRDIEHPPRNLCVWSNAHRDRVLRGATDYEGTPSPDLGGPPGVPVKDAHVVYGGVDTDFYCPSDYAKDDYYLWMNRWHPAKGYRQAIDLARRTGIRLVVAGEHPDHLPFEAEKECAHEAETLGMWARARDIATYYLPPDPDHHTAKRELYRRARALLYPVQFQEPFGLSMVEAMACGTPVLGIDYGSVPEIASACVSPEQWLQAHEAINEACLESPEMCRKRAVANYSRAAFAKRYLAEYERVLAGESW